jgi:hypothetical protein
MQPITSLEHAQRILRQRDLHDAQAQQLLDYLLRQQLEHRQRLQGMESLLLVMLEFTRLVITHVETTGHADNQAIKDNLARTVEAMRLAQEQIRPARDKTSG